MPLLNILSKVNNSCMDWVLLAICLFFTLKGFFKGFVFMLFSFVSTFLVVILAWQLSEIFLPTAQNLFFPSLSHWLESAFDSAVPGQFENAESLMAGLAGSKFSVFGVFILRILGKISFDGNLSAGQILAPTLANLLLKVLCFVILFVLLWFSVKIIRFLINKFVKKFGLSFPNKCMGAGVGLLKGVLIFGIFYFVTSCLANLLVNQSLLDFVVSGKISGQIYNNFVLQIVKLFGF